MFNKKIHRWKTNLIDLSKRNRLINFKDNISTVIKFNTDIDEMYQLLSNDKSIKVQSITDIQRFVDKEKRLRKKKLALEEENDAIDFHEIEQYAFEKLENSLQSIRLKAKSSLDEKGVNTLFITFGQLIWKESEDSNIEMKSPLLLLPVTLKRESSGMPYYIERFDDDLTLNPTLVQKIKGDFGIVLPPIHENGEINITNYLEIVSEAIKGFKEWTVTRDVYIGFFSFSKLVMYKDFEQFSSEISQHDIVQKLAGVSKDYEQGDYEESDSIRNHDRVSKSMESFQILDADSSQQEAILAANNGKSFIISGPPGTGKSQTISNIIAECLAKGKKVLFVSEKKAALEVVKKRLDNQRLGDFCLELHSNNTNKKVVLAELDRTLNQQYSPRSTQGNFETFDKIKKHLNAYTEALHMPIGSLQYTAHRVHGELSKLDQVQEIIFTIENVGDISQSKLSEINDLLERLRQYAHVLKGSETHLWSGSNVKRFTLELQSDISVKFKRLSNDLRSISEIIEGLMHELGINWSAQPESFINLQSLNELFKNIPVVPEEWLRTDRQLAHKTLLYEEATKKFEDYHQAKQLVTSFYNEDVWMLQVDEIVSILLNSRSGLVNLLPKEEDFINELAHTEQPTLSDLKVLQISLSDLALFNSDISQMVGVDSDTCTLEQEVNFLFILEKINLRLCPTSYWFDPETMGKVKEVLSEARTNIEEYITDTATFNLKYDRQLLEREEFDGMLERFMMNYTSFFRIFNRSYRNDQKFFCFHSKTGSNPKFHELLHDVKMVERLKNKKRWIESESDRLKGWLGDHYKGIETNWDLLVEQIEHIEILNTFISNHNLPYEKIKGLILQSTMIELESVEILYKKTARALSLSQEVASTVEPLISKAIAYEIDKTPISELKQVIESVITSSDLFLGAKSGLAPYVKQVPYVTYDELLSSLTSIGSYKEKRQNIEGNRELFKSAFGSLFEDFDTNWEMILTSLEWTKNLKQLFIGNIPEEIIRVVSSQDRLIPQLLDKGIERVRVHLKDSLSFMQFFQSIFPEESAVFNGKTMKESEYRICVEYMDKWVDGSYKLEEWLAVQQILTDAEKLGIQEFIQEVKQMNTTDQVNFTDTFLKRYYKLWLDYAYESLPALSHFNADQHNKLIGQFKDLDKSQLDTNGSRIHLILNTNKKSRLSNPELGHQVGLLRREISKKTKHKPIRKLFIEIPDVIFALKPCLMMSPMSVSQFIDPSAIKFDTVIFDEASQLCTEDAVGSIFRGKQIIIAGDKKQLPPSRFFGTSIEEDEEFMDEEDESNDSYESVLEEASIFMKVKSLQWHYRSKHESLIAFSNKEIYDDQLYTFPSSSSNKNDGVSLVYVADGVYERSTSRRNLIEAKMVAKLVFDHIEKSPERSLGVIAFSEAQQQAILDQIYALRKQNVDRHVEAFFDDSKSDYFFVKNLENVQGDERDTIFFSVGYGKDANGVIYYNFGPLNKPGGERRLNVAVTRAKYEIKLVSSILHSDLDDAKLNKRGPQLLKSYLYYASTGGKLSSNTGIQNGGEFDSPLEEDIYEALTAQGLILNKQVGCSSYRIDLAVVDPNNSGNYIMGIECDGASYHSSKTARDRDRLRQEILESLGWKIHRIWSQDWFRRKKDEISRIMDEINKLKG